MGYLVCDKCKGYYLLKEGESPDDFDLKCDCGGNLHYTENIIKNPELNNVKTIDDMYSEEPKPRVQMPSTGYKQKAKENNNKKSNGIIDFWNNRGIGGKITVSIVGLVIVGFLLLMVAAAFSGSGMSAGQIEKTAIPVNADVLYNDTGALVGKPVVMTGEVIQTGDNQMRVSGISLDQDGYNNETTEDILIDGDFSNQTIYENDVVVVYGIFEGQSSYTTVLGADRKIPEIDQATIQFNGTKLNN